MTPRRLDGWKAIAAHMNRSVRQCQRLVKQAGLPVRHLPGRRSVFAFEEELDAWFAGAEAAEKGEPEAGAPPPTRPAPHAAPPAEPSRAPSGVPVTTPETTASGESAASRGHLGGILVLGSLMVLAAGLYLYRTTSGWRSRGAPLSGTWTFVGRDLEGASSRVGRYDTGFLFGPGSSATVRFRSQGTRWAGGLEIFEDELHWTYISVSPPEHAIHVQRFPAGTVNTFFAGSALAPGATVQLTISSNDHNLTVSCGSCRKETVGLRPYDVGQGKLFLRVGAPGDETHPAAGGSCRFTDLEVHGVPTALPPLLAEETPVSERPTAQYTLTVDNIDDQIDVLLDGRRLVSGGYLEKIGPMSLTPFLRRGRHTLVARLFNRKWAAMYGITLERDGVPLWSERCGDVLKEDGGCPHLGNRLGMVEELSYTFDAR